MTCPFCGLPFDSEGMLGVHVRRCHTEAAETKVTWFQDCPPEVQARSCWPESLHPRMVYVEAPGGNYWRLA